MSLRKKPCLRFKEGKVSVLWKSTEMIQKKPEFSSANFIIYCVLGMRMKDIIPLLNELNLLGKTQ